MEYRKGVFKMRILRLYAPSLIGDHTLCYVHCNSAGESCINEVPIRISYSCAGEDMPAEYSDSMTIVFPSGTKFRDGDFLSVSNGGALLSWKDETESFSVVKNGFFSVSAFAEKWKPITAGVLTISDKGSRNERVDTAGPELEEQISALGGVVKHREIVPDDKELISRRVTEWASAGCNVILTTGGTGLSPRDVTPEALLAVAEKVVPGFGEMMRMKTLAFTPRAFLTRGIAVIVKNSLVIAFPGSRRGAKQCFEAIAPGLRHGVETLLGWDSECGNEHKH